MPTLNRLHGVFATCVLVASATAYAEDQPTLTDPPKEQEKCETNVEPAECPQPAPAPAPTTSMAEPTPMAEPTYEEAPRPWYDRMGWGFSIGGGVGDFVGDRFRDFTGVAGGWQARLTWGTNYWLAVEASYFGSAQSIDAIGLDSDAILVSNGLQGALRGNFLRNSYVQPFVYAGAAWRRYDLTNEVINTSDVADSDDLFELPVGVGVAGYIYGFMADVRGEYRNSWGADLIPALDLLDNDTIAGPMDTWSVNASIGASF